MEGVENTIPRPSGLRPPSRVHGSPGKGLSEISSSDNNMRATMPSMLPPPSTTTQKHKLSNLPEPAPKRKTLAERAGEPHRPASAMAGERRGLQQPSSTRNINFSASVSSARTTSTSSTHSSSSMASSIGHSRPHAMPRSKYGQRPQTALGHTRSQSTIEFSHPSNNALDASQGPAADAHNMSKRKGKVPSFHHYCRTPSHAQKNTIIAPRQRGQLSLNKDTTSVATTTDSSTSEGDGSPRVRSRDAAIATEDMMAKSATRNVSLSTAFNKLSLDATTSINTSVQKDDLPKEEDAAPQTPSHIPRPAPPQAPAQPTSFFQALKDHHHKKHHSTTKTPNRSRSTSPIKPFLSRFTNMQAPAWDTKGRLEDMEMLYTQLRSQLEGTSNDRRGLEESISLYKQRSTSTHSSSSSTPRVTSTLTSTPTTPQSLLDARSAVHRWSAGGASPSSPARGNAKLTHSLVHLVHELESIRSQLSSKTQSLQMEVDDARKRAESSSVALDEARRSHNRELDDRDRRHGYERAELKDKHRAECERLRKDATDTLDAKNRTHTDERDRLLRDHRDALDALTKKLHDQLDDEKSRNLKDRDALLQQSSTDRAAADAARSLTHQELEALKSDVARKAADLDMQRTLNEKLRGEMQLLTTEKATVELNAANMKAKIDFLQSGHQAQSQAFEDCHRRMEAALAEASEARDKLRAEETLRRKLHNTIQELKGNIRVFCRVRPALANGATSGAEGDGEAKFDFPDAEAEMKEVSVQGPETFDAMNQKTRSKTNTFSFDRVFGPAAQNAGVFEEISQLVQSALDGYNVCIFCYGQTGSGKTYTMSAEDGMIPRATAMIYSTAEALREKGWNYTMAGSFVEVYNESLNDLLGTAEDMDKKKCDIRHDAAKGTTEVVNANTVTLDSAERVRDIMRRASKNRSVAATKANERSSRSHSVFILKIVGTNEVTGERSEATLNLVDLAGSERLAQSQAAGDRLKETQSINKSLSCLGDVIAALGQKGAHIPYRNSKLTYLLQNSLGGNSKTLMFVMVSPQQAHLSETLTSLKFATKVHNTHIGVAKKQSKA